MKNDATIGMIRINASIFAAALMVFDVASVARATTAVYDPVSATASSELASSPPRTADQTRNGSGLAFAVPVTINSIADLPNHNEDADDMWLTDNDPSSGTGSGHVGWIVFDLGAPTKINVVYVWNYAEQNTGFQATPDFFTAEGANAVTIYADNSPISPTITGVNGTINNNGSTTVVSTNFAQEHPNSAANPAAFAATPQEIDIPTVTAQYVEFAINSNFDASKNFVGLSEVRFGFVPEPSAGLLCLFGGIGMLTRRRRLAA